MADNSIVYQPGSTQPYATEGDSGSTEPATPVYRGDEVRIAVPANTLENGKAYYWKVELGQDEFDIFITSGRTTKASSGSELYIGTGITIINTLYQRIKIGGSYYPIISYNSSTGYLQIDGEVNVAAKTQYYIYSNTLQSTSFFFETRAEPVVTIPEIKYPYTQRTISLTGTYEQSNGTHIKFHRWDLYCNGEIIDTTGNRYHERLEYKFDGLISGNVYFVELCGETQDGVPFSSGRKMIEVEYAAPTMEAPPTVSVVDEKSAIRVDVDGVTQIAAVDSGENNTFSTIDGKNCYQLNDGKLSALFTDAGIDKENFYIQLKTMLDRSSINDIIRIDFDDGTYMTVSFNGSEFKCDDNGTIRDLASLFRSYAFCLTNDGISAPGVCYRWDDTQIWDDTKIWTESTFDFDTFIIGISPNACTVEGVDW